jgi:multimeric flavodoxin WrbA
MKVLLVNGSPHAAGCTFTALKEMEKVFQNEKVETEVIHVGHLDIHGCIGCRKCVELGHCVFQDIVNEVAEKFKDADGLVVGSPVYYASPAGSLLAFLDRLFTSASFDKTMKVGAAVVSARRAGTITSFDVLNKYFAISGMPIASSQYWNEVQGSSAAEVVQDLEGMQTVRILARNMAFLMKSIALGKKEYGLPDKEERVWTNFIR